MAKPRVFISSTYYDFRFVRESLKVFIRSLGYEPVLFEEGSISFALSEALDEACYSELTKCDMVILIIGGRYGSGSSTPSAPTKGSDATFESVTRREYTTAATAQIPIFLFIQNDVKSEYATWQKSIGKAMPSDFEWAHVDTPDVFRFIQLIEESTPNMWRQGFETVDEIITWLRDQWAGLFARYLQDKSDDNRLKSLEDQIQELSSLVVYLREYQDIIVKSLEPKASSEITGEIKKIEGEEQKIAHARMLRRFALFLEEASPMYVLLSRRVSRHFSRMALLDGLLHARDFKEFLGQMKANFRGDSITNAELNQSFTKIFQEFGGFHAVSEDIKKFYSSFTYKQG